MNGNRDAILNAIRAFAAENGYAPSVRDLCAATGIKSTSTVHHHLRMLAREGAIRRGGVRGTRRALAVVGVCPTCGRGEAA